MRSDRGVGAAGRPFGAVVTVLAFGLLLCWLDATIASNLIGRLRTLGYAAADGRVTDSLIDEYATGKRGRSRAYDATVRYAYVVDGTSYVGTHSGRSEGLTAGRGAAEQIIALYPPGRAVTVWYDAGSPHESVIVRGVRGEDMFPMLFAVPLHLAVAGGAVVLGRAVWRAVRPASWPGVRVRRRGGRVRLRLPVARAWGPALTAAGVTAGVALILFMAGLAVVSATYVPVGLPVLGLGLAWMAGAVAYDRANAAFPPRRPVLTLDPAARVLHVPAVYRGQVPQAIPYDQVTGVRVGGQNLRTSTWGPEVCHPTLTWKEPGKTGGSVVLTAWPGADWVGATRLVRWLETELGLRARAQQGRKVGRRRRGRR